MPSGCEAMDASTDLQWFLAIVIPVSISSALPIPRPAASAHRITVRKARRARSPGQPLRAEVPGETICDEERGVLNECPDEPGIQ